MKKLDNLENIKPPSKSKLLKLARKLEKEQDKEFGKAVKERDGWKCVICGDTNKPNCHHILPRENRTLRHDLMNGITLCILHHKFSLKISPHKNAFEFFCWLEKNRLEQFLYLKDKVNTPEQIKTEAVIVELENGSQ